MNGQDRSHPLASSSTGTNGAPSGAVNSQSWLRDMVADPVRAAQAGIINPRQDTGQNSIPTLSQFDIPSSRPYGLAFQMLQNAYNVNGGQLNHMYPPGIQSSGDHPVAAPSAATYSAAAEGGQQRLPLTAATVTTDTLSVRPVFTQPSSTKSSVSNEYGPDMPAKRLKPSADDTSASSSLPPTATHPHSSTPPIPHRPDYFHKGSVIQLSEQKLKRIEDLHTSDFETSASISSNLSLDCSTVTKIVEDKRRGTAFLTFSVGDRHRRQSVRCFLYR